MPDFDEDGRGAPRRSVGHEIGQDLSSISVKELTERVELLKSEIERLEREISSKTAQRSAADLLFRR